MTVSHSTDHLSACLLGWSADFMDFGLQRGLALGSDLLPLDLHVSRFGSQITHLS